MRLRQSKPVDASLYKMVGALASQPVAYSKVE